MITLKQLCDAAGATRRAVQEYESMGLVQRRGKNKMGHLLYDVSAVDQVKLILQYKDFGFSLKEIKEMQTMSNSCLKEIMEKKLVEFKKKVDSEKQRIYEMEQIIEALECAEE